MKIVIFGLSITSSWGNGHATTFRALAKALHRRGHRIVFFEHDLYWYADNRDLPDPAFCDLRLFKQWSEIVSSVRRELADAEVGVVGSYFPDGMAATDELIDSTATVKCFYDIDTPITVGQLRANGTTEYLRATQVPGFDFYFSFTGGPMLREIEERFGARSVQPLYCSFDPDQYRPCFARRFACDLSYMGTYAPDRQPKIEELLCNPARRQPGRSFLVAGPQYPKSVRWPKNVRRIMHLNPSWHPHFYSSSRLTLNVTRRDMVMAGYSPSVRLFEAAACGATIVSDNWPGLETFFAPGEQILLPASGEDVMRYISGYEDAELDRIGRNARARVLAEHSNDARAQEFLDSIEGARCRIPVPSAAAS